MSASFVLITLPTAKVSAGSLQGPTAKVEYLLAFDRSGPTIGKVMPNYFIIPPKRDGSFGPEVDFGERPV